MDTTPDMQLPSSLNGDILAHMTHPASERTLDSLAIRQAVAAEVRAALARDGRKAAALATATGISNSALSRKLKGEAPIWTEQLIRIAAELRIDPASLLTAALARQDAGAVAA